MVMGKFKIQDIDLMSAMEWYTEEVHGDHRKNLADKQEYGVGIDDDGKGNLFFVHNSNEYIPLSAPIPKSLNEKLIEILIEQKIMGEKRILPYELLVHISLTRLEFVQEHLSRDIDPHFGAELIRCYLKSVQLYIQHAMDDINTKIKGLSVELKDELARKSPQQELFIDG